MNDDTTISAQTDNGHSQHERLRAPTTRAYLALLGAAALSGAALHMVRSTSAADMPEWSAQHLTRPTELPHIEIDTSLQPVGL